MRRKMPISWHEEGAMNMEKALQQDREKLALMENTIRRDEARLAFRWRQIQTARDRGMSEFDGDRLCVSRKKEATHGK